MDNRYQATARQIRKLLRDAGLRRGEPERLIKAALTGTLKNDDAERLAAASTRALKRRRLKRSADD